MVKGLTVVKANHVINASYKLSVIEQRVILAAIAQIPKGQVISDQKFYEVTIAHMQQLGTHETEVYSVIKEATSKLYERSINLMVDGVEFKTRWVQSIQFHDNKSVVSIKFTHDILPFISNLSEHFTKYSLLDVSNMTSSYAIRLYELLTQYKGIGSRELFISELRKMFELEEQYSLFADFKKRVIDTAVKQINEHSPLTVDYTEHKTGRRVTSLVFTFKSKQQTRTGRDTQTLDMFTKLTDNEIRSLAIKLSNHPEVGSKFADTGESSSQFIARLEKELKNPETFKKYKDYL